MSNKIIVFPGSFNPFHNGHLEIIQKISKKYTVLILISNNPKKEKISFQKRFNQINYFLSLNRIDNIIIGLNFGLTVDFLKQINVNIILRGFRNKEDIKYERILIKEYKKEQKNLKIKLIKSRNNKETSSSLLRNNNQKI